MVVDEEYDIRTEDNKLFCKGRRDADGRIYLRTKNAEIPLEDLEAKALCPDRQRGKRRLKHQGVSKETG